MNWKTFHIMILLLLVRLAAGAQTLQEGRDLFSAGNYQAALPIMEKYSKQQPENATRAYWYGVCLFETGQREESLPYLEKAARKKIIKAYRYMALCYSDKMRYQEAIESYDKLLDGMAADKELHNEALEAIYKSDADRLRKAYRMLRNTERVCFVDSFVVSKDNFLKKYVLDPSAGSIGTYSGTFGGDKEGDVFIPETKGSIYFSRMDTDSIFKLYHGYRSSNEWTDITPVSLNADSSDIRYPFMMNDGVTIYFASNGPESIGGYDIFVTRHNPSTGSYLVPENIGMPFNSSANDYMYVIDETTNLGWFATDRGQNPENVCIYVFIPNKSRVVYNYEENREAVAKAALISSIADTQINSDEVRTARQRLTMLTYSYQEKSEKGAFSFIIDDLTTYHDANDFRNPEAKTMFSNWMKARAELEENSAKLLKIRDLWSSISQQEHDRLYHSTLDLEKTVEELERTVIADEIRIRNAEIQYLTR